LICFNFEEINRDAEYWEKFRSQLFSLKGDRQNHFFSNFGENVFLMITKEQIKQSIDSLPDDFTLEDIIEELIFIEKIEQGRQDIINGDIYSTDEVKKQLEEWSK